VIEYPLATRECRILFPQKEDYFKSLEMMVKLREIGKPSPAIDIIIGAMCIRRGLRLLTKDMHLARIARHFLSI